MRSSADESTGYRRPADYIQLLPRPGILARVRYTFDYLDLAASLLSLLLAYIVIERIVPRPKPPES